MKFVNTITHKYYVIIQLCYTDIFVIRFSDGHIIFVVIGYNQLHEIDCI